MRYSRFLIPTLREDPGEAEVASHRLMLRAGMTRKLAAGIYTYLPLGLRIMNKMIKIVREEMERIGAQELLMPAVQPDELWQESGRWDLYGKELLRFKDRHGREFCIGPTHEEVITDLMRREIRSYRQLPITLYQIQTKFRDEIRPRFGLMRGREFLMKDAYSFGRDEEDARETYKSMHDAYTRIFNRCGLKFRAVEADTGLIGGTFSHEFMVMADTGEEAVVSCGSCEYAANMERAESKVDEGGTKAEKDEEIKRVVTPRVKSVEEVSAFLGVKPDKLVKTLIYQTETGPVAVLVRGDHEANEVRLKNLISANELMLSDQEAIEKITGGPSGFSGPVGLRGIKIVADHAIGQLSNFIVGGNEKDVHLVNVNIGRDFKVDQFSYVRKVLAGDPCPKCESPLSIDRGIEVGQLFILGKKYSEPMSAKFLNRNGEEVFFFMGCYGIGIGRTIAAAVEQNHDKDGIIWPIPLAPFHVQVIPLNVNNEKVMITSELIYGSLLGVGIDVLIDDRDERPGVKFKDADLIGTPYHVIVGEKNLNEGFVEFKDRRTRELKKVTVEEIIDHLKGLFNRRRR
ncbi:MAG: proline--tRNA ligase [Nitrospirota bacterium]